MSKPCRSRRCASTASRRSTLRRLGLKTVGALLDLPRATLARRFRGETIAENVLIRLDEMLGRRDEPLNPLNPPSSFMAHRTLMEPVISSEGLETVLTGLVTGSVARSRNEGAGRHSGCMLKLFRSDGSRISLPAGFSAATHDPRHMLRVLKPKLEARGCGLRHRCHDAGGARDGGRPPCSSTASLEDDQRRGAGAAERPGAEPP